MLRLQSSFAKIVLSLLSAGFFASSATAQDQTKTKQYDWAVDVTYAESTRTRARDLKITTAGMRVWLINRDVIAVGVKGGSLWSEGRTTENGGETYNSGDALGVYLGIPVRIQANKSGQVRPFIEAAISGIATDRNWPARDPDRTDYKTPRFYAKFDAVLGAEIMLDDATSITASGFLSHISNGRGLGPDNLNFDGAGAMLSFSKRY